MPCTDIDDDTHDSAYAIGWDHARHGLTPPLERLCINPRLRDGFRAGRAARTRPVDAPSAATADWLALRLRALAEGRSFETVRLTPGYLSRLAVTHCPVTREPIGAGRIVRLRNDAGYAAGNLALCSARAGLLKDALDDRRALDWLARGGAAPLPADGLTLAQQRRLALLASFARPLAHEAASALPLVVLPPVGAMLFNPVQALQVCIARAWLDATPNRRLAALRAALPDAHSRDAFDAFVAAYAVLLGTAAPTRWSLEDAWADAGLVRRWKRFAGSVTAARCESLVLHHEPASALQRPDGLATEGWALDSGGRARLRRAPLRFPADRGAVTTPVQRFAPLPARAVRSAQRALFGR